MDKKRSCLLIVVILAIVLIVIVVIIMRAKGRRSKSSPSDSSLSRSRTLVGNWKHAAGLPAPSPSATVASDDPFSYRLILDQPLDIYKMRIFPLQIRDVLLTTVPEQDPDYPALISALKGYPRAPTKEELIFLLKYRKFMGRDDVYSMCGPREVEQMYVVLLNVVANKIPGDVIETGVWKGGMGMWMKAVLNHFRRTGKDESGQDRKLWLFDAFGKFPEPQIHTLENGEEITPHSKDLSIHSLTKVMYQNPPTVYQVRDNFEALGLLDDNVRLVQGLFSKTIPAALQDWTIDPVTEAGVDRQPDIERIAVLRLDNDYHDSVLFVLENLYPLVSKGGFVVIDDYNNPILGCKEAVHFFRSKYNITAPIMDTYGGSIYWQV